MKKIGKILCALLLFMFMTGCGSSKDVSGSLEDIMTKLYEGIPESNLPMGLSNTELTSDDIEYKKNDGIAKVFLNFIRSRKKK